MNIKRLLKSYLIVAVLVGTSITLLFLLKGLVLMFPIFFEHVGRTLLVLLISIPFVGVTYSILKKIEEKNKK
tara:strand:- start:366 stop:581 length:216 start_codon:yes stop_codon:yes gene_type:complete